MYGVRLKTTFPTGKANQGPGIRVDFLLMLHHGANLTLTFFALSAVGTHMRNENVRFVSVMIIYIYIYIYLVDG